MALIKISIHKLCDNHFTCIIDKSQGGVANPSNLTNKNFLGEDGYQQAIEWLKTNLTNKQK